MTNQKVCLQCGSVGTSQEFKKGSVLTGIVFLFFFVLPGIIYFIWRGSTAYQGCRVCKSANVIPVDSPASQRMMAEGKMPSLAVIETSEKQKSKDTLVGTCVFVGIILLFVLASRSC